ncbi:MAG: hypothetical protein PVJ67_05660 [Candidatus Pacearchaeota archaeon]|jgi:hypothetical protein
MKKGKPELYENYPWKNVLIYNLVTWSVYFAGLFLMFSVHLFAGVLFFVYILFIEYSVYKDGCRHCYYYGKRCVAGRGKIAPLFFKKGNPKKFCEKTLSFKDFIPSLLVAFIPMLAGIYLLIKDFSFLILGLTLWPLIVNFVGNPIVYGELACPHCRQGAKCCPACEYFKKNYEPRGKKKK